MAHACLVQAHVLDVRPPSGGNEQMRGLQRLAPLEAEPQRPRPPGDAREARPLADLDALCTQPVERHGSHLGVLAAERLCRLEHDDPAAEAPVRLG